MAILKTIETTMSELEDVLRYCEASNLAPFIQGAPGVGKSAIGAQYARAMKREFIDVRLAYYAPQDIQGYPYLDSTANGKTMRFSLPAFWPETSNPVILLEEFNCATKSVQNTSLQLLNERCIGDHKLPEDAFICLLGNRAEDRVNIEKLSSAVVNRICNVRVKLDLKGWVKWAQKAGIDPITIAFLQWRPELLSNFEGAKWDGVSNFASPRTWEKASNITQHCPDRGIRHALLEGVLGQGAAAEYVGFLGVYEKLPDIKTIFSDPTGQPVPTEASAKYAVCAGISKLVTPKTMEAALTYLGRLTKEFAVFAVKTAVFRNPDLYKSPAFTKWAVANQDVFAKR